jgi:GH15 family glucan-1,4-alpha-glucosidase
VLARGPESFIKRTADYWNVWVRQGGKDFDGLPESIVRLYQQSLLILRTHLNYNGAALAANDSDILRFARDTYCYMWPRDAALIVYALDLAGYGESARRFYRLCSEIIQERGLLPAQVQPGRHARLVVASVARRRRIAAADPGGRDRARPVGVVGTLSHLRRRRVRQAALPPR